MAFSILKNFPAIVSIDPGRQYYVAMSGIRFFSMAWIVLGHTWDIGVYMVFTLPPTIAIHLEWPSLHFCAAQAMGLCSYIFVLDNLDSTFSYYLIHPILPYHHTNLRHSLYYVQST